MAIANHAGKDPVLIAALVQIAIMGIMHRPFIEIVSGHIDDPVVIKNAVKLEHLFPPAPNLLNAFRGEVIFCRVTAQRLRDNPSAFDLPQTRKFKDAKFTQDVIDACEARMISQWRGLFSELRSTKSDALECYRMLKDFGNSQEQMNGKPTYELSSIMFPVLHQAQTSDMRSEAMRQLRTTLLSLAHYHMIQKSFPDSLKSSTTPGPLDPFTNKPLIYRRTPNGFILYSVGENFKDDGGRAKKRNKDDKDTDIVVEYPYMLDPDK